MFIHRFFEPNSLSFMTIPKSDALVLFGATGDLAHKKLFDTIQALYRRGVLNGPVIGVAKGDGMTREQLIERAREGITTFGRGVDEAAFKKFADSFQFVDGDYSDPLTFENLKKALGALNIRSIILRFHRCFLERSPRG